MTEGAIDVVGRFGWRARYLKEVDSADRTVRFWQEIYDQAGTLVEIHEKFPVDKAITRYKLGR